jgi:hypothetical protein
MRSTFRNVIEKICSALTKNGLLNVLLLEHWHKAVRHTLCAQLEQRLSIPRKALASSQRHFFHVLGMVLGKN